MTIADHEMRDAQAAMRVIHSLHIDWLSSLTPEDAEGFAARMGGVDFSCFLQAYRDRWLELGYIAAENTPTRRGRNPCNGPRHQFVQPLYSFRAEAVGAAGLAILRREAEDYTAMCHLLDQPPPDDASELTDPPS